MTRIRLSAVDEVAAAYSIVDVEPERSPIVLEVLA